MATPHTIIRGQGLRGGLPDYLIKSLTRDRIGVFTGIIERHYPVGPKNQRVDLAWLDPRTAPNPWGIPCVDARSSIADSLCTVVYRYEGAEEADESPAATSYELDTTLAEKPIQTHPKFGTFKLLYGWDDATERFSELVPGTVDNSTSWRSRALSNDSSARAGEKNPLFGTETYFSVSALYSITFARRVVPANVLRGLGTIIKAPPRIGDFRLPSAARKRNWLKLGPRLLKRGNITQITMQYALGHVSGWRKEVYAAGQLEEESPE